MKKNEYPTPQFDNKVQYAKYLNKPLEEVSWEDVVALIVNSPSSLAALCGELRELVRLGDTETYSRRKKMLPVVLPAAVFDKRRVAGALLRLTGCSMVDFDHVPAERLAEVKKLLCRDRHTFLCHTTPSGEGLRVIFRYRCDAPELAYLDAWRAGNRHFAALASLPFDEATKDVTRLSFLCHDPEAFFNPQAEPLPVESPKPEAPSRKSPLAEAEAEVEAKGLRYQPGSRHNYLVELLFNLLHRGVPQEEACRHIASAYPDSDDDAAELTASVYQHADQFGTRPAKAKAPGLAEWLDLERSFRFNVLTGGYETLAEGEWRMVDDRAVNSLWLRYAQAYGKPQPAAHFWQAIQSDAVPRHNPATAYLEALPPWDGQDHIAALAARITLAPPASRLFFETCFRKWFTSLVASMRSSRTVNHTALILIGPQGIYKSTFFRHLLPPELRDYYLEKSTSSRMSKDDRLSLAEYILIGLEEIDTMTPKELSQLKALMTASSIDERAAYDKLKTRRPHLASFCGTGNNLEMLTDPSGNRRFLTFEVASIASPYLNPVPYAQLYAQALALVEGGYEHWLSKEEEALLAEHQKRFLAHSDEQELLLQHYSLPASEAEGKWVPYAAILHYLVQQERVPVCGSRLQQSLRQLGFEKKRTNGRTMYFVHCSE